MHDQSQIKAPQGWDRIIDDGRHAKDRQGSYPKCHVFGQVLSERVDGSGEHIVPNMLLPGRYGGVQGFC